MGFTSVKFRQDQTTIKLVQGMLEWDSNGQYSKIYKDTDYFCQIHACYADYRKGSLMSALKPDSAEVQAACLRSQESGKLLLWPEPPGETRLLLTPDITGDENIEEDDLRNIYGSFSESFERIAAQHEDIKNFRISLFAEMEKEIELAAALGFVEQITQNSVRPNIKRWVFDCNEFSFEAFFQILQGLGMETVAPDVDEENISRCLFAIGARDRKLISSELERKLNLNQFNGYGNSMLFEAIHHNDLQTIDLLLAKGASVHARNNRGISAIISCAATGNIEIARKLIDAGANLTDASLQDETALMHAAFAGHSELVRLLLKSGAVANKTNVFELNASQIARMRGFENIANEIDEAS